MNGVPGSGNPRVASAIRTPICPAMPTNLRSRPPAISRTGTAISPSRSQYDGWAPCPMPRRLLASQRRDAQADVAQAQNLVRRKRWLPRSGAAPLADERLDSGFFDPPRQFLIRFRALVSFVLILNTGGSALQDQRGDPLRRVTPMPERQSATHRVAKPVAAIPSWAVTSARSCSACSNA